MADDEWSALDEELEKALSGKKGKKGKRDSVLSSARATDLSGSSATGSEPAKPSGTKSLDDPSAVASTAYVPPAATARDPAPAPNETLDEWSALDEELEKLERGKKRRGVPPWRSAMLPLPPWPRPRRHRLALPRARWWLRWLSLPM